LADSGPAHSGFDYDDKVHHLSVSTDFIEKTLDSIERISAIFVDWASKERGEFAIIAGLFALIIILRHLRLRDEARMKLAFEERRSNSTEPELPLPEPSARLPSPGKAEAK